jgi:hypothetical protein
MDNEYKVTLDRARNELNESLAQKAVLEDRIAKLRQTIGGLARLCGEPGDVEPVSGWTLIDAIREVLRTAPVRQYLTTEEIKDGLVLIDYDVTTNVNIQASIQTTLRRMIESGEAEAGVKGDKKGYRLLGFMERQRTGSSILKMHDKQQRESFYGPKSKKGKR